MENLCVESQNFPKASRAKTLGMILRSFVLFVLAASVESRPQPPHLTRWPRQTPAPTTPLTTKVYLWEMRWAVNLDYGKFTPMAFQYYNDQFMTGPHPRHDYDRCYDDYIRCNLGISHPYTVCGFRTLDRWDPKMLLRPMSYCEVYHDNCMRGYRYWRVLDFGYCINSYYFGPYLDTAPMNSYFWATANHPYKPPPSLPPYNAY